MDSLGDFKRSFTKSASAEEFNNELNDLKRLVNDDKVLNSRYGEILRFILEEAETGRAGKRKRADPSSQKALQVWSEDQPSRTRSQRKSKGKQPAERSAIGKKAEKQIEPKGENKDEEGKRKRVDPAGNSSQKALQLGSNRDDAGQSSRTRIQRKSKGKQPIIPKGVNKEQEAKRKKTLEIRVKVEGEKKSNVLENEPAGKRKKRLDIVVKVEGEKKAPNPVPKWKKRIEKATERLEKITSTTSAPVPQSKKGKVDEDESVKKKKAEVKIEEESNPEPEKTPPSQTKDKGKGVAIEQPIFSSPFVPSMERQASVREPEKTPASQMEDKGKGVAIEQPIFSSPFVPSWGQQASLLVEGAETLVFRDEVLTVQRQPFDLDEYSRLQEAVIAGSYLDHHEDLKRILLSQCKREKRLAILRGFFFWFQNVGHKGAFKPWNDCVCLEVDPPHVS